MISKKLFLVLIFFSTGIYSHARVRVLVTLPDFIEVVRAIGGERVEVDSLLDGTEDPHFVDAVPSFISKAAKADMLCAVGLDLEIGWLPKVLSKSANRKIQRGGKGFCELGKSITALEKHTGHVDRSMGDVHAAGNPHFNLSPVKIAESSQEILRVLTEIDPEGAKQFEINSRRFNERMMSLKQEIVSKLIPLKGKALIQFHKEFTYFFEEYRLTGDTAIEEKPGVPPSSARIAQVSNEAKIKKIVLAIGAPHSSTKHLEKFSEISGIPYIKVPSGVQKEDTSADTIWKLQNRLADDLLRATQF